MPSRTDTVTSRPQFLAETQNMVRDMGRQIDWDGVPTSYENQENNKEIKGGTPVAFGSASDGNAGVRPRAATERTITSISESGGTVTVTTQNDHSYEVGEQARITGTSNYDGYYTITGVPASDQYQFSISTSPADESSGTSYQPAEGILLTTANENSDTDALTGYGVVRGGHIYEDLLNLEGQTLADIKDELDNYSSYGYAWSTYRDDRS